MSGYKKLSAAQIGDTFKKLADKQKDFMDIYGIGNILRALSDSVKTMQDAGIDISIDVRSGQYADAYDMIFSNTEAKEAAVSTYGFLRIGHTVRLWAIANCVLSAAWSVEDGGEVPQGPIEAARILHELG